MVAEHPLLYVAYILWAEYFTVLLGDDWLDALADCGFGRSQLTAVAKHVEADRDHIQSGFGEVDQLWHGEPPADHMLRVVERAGRLFSRFCDEICVEARRAA